MSFRAGAVAGGLETGKGNCTTGSEAASMLTATSTGAGDEGSESLTAGVFGLADGAIWRLSERSGMNGVVWVSACRLVGPCALAGGFRPNVDRVRVHAAMRSVMSSQHHSHTPTLYQKNVKSDCRTCISNLIVNTLPIDIGRSRYHSSSERSHWNIYAPPLARSETRTVVAIAEDRRHHNET
jgi:hypothetical protein